MELFQELGESGISSRPDENGQMIVAGYDILDQGLIGRILEEHEITEIGREYIKIRFDITKYISNLGGVEDNGTWFIPLDEYRKSNGDYIETTDLVMTLVEWGTVHINRNSQIEFKLVEDVALV